MTDRRADFRALHHTGRPLLLPNAWDHASAAALAARGHPAIGTTSLGVAAAAGRPDGTAATAQETLALARRLANLPVLLSVDIEAGFSDDPAAVAGYVAELAGLGVVGINLEDGRADGTLTEPECVAAKVAAVKAAVPDLFVNARTDTWWLGVDDPLPQTLARAHAYRAMRRRRDLRARHRRPGHAARAHRADRRPGERAVPAGRTRTGRAGRRRGCPGQHRLPAVPGGAGRRARRRRPGTRRLGSRRTKGCRRTPRCRAWCRRAPVSNRTVGSLRSR